MSPTLIREDTSEGPTADLGGYLGCNTKGPTADQGGYLGELIREDTSEGPTADQGGYLGGADSCALGVAHEGEGGGASRNRSSLIR